MNTLYMISSNREKILKRNNLPTLKFKARYANVSSPPPPFLGAYRCRMQMTGHIYRFSTIFIFQIFVTIFGI